jgi:hypothetical protein
MELAELAKLAKLRELGETQKAWQCYQEAVSRPDVSPPVLAKLAFEGSILAYYNDASSGLRLSYQALGSPYLSDAEYQCVHSNLVFYAPPLFDTSQSQESTHEGTGYTYTTPTFLGDDVVYRLVNYSIDDRGCYTIRDPRGVVRTENEWFGRGLLKIRSSKVPTRPDALVQGLEDLRLTRSDDGVTYGLAASFQYSVAEGVVSQVLFQIDETTLDIDVLAVLSLSSSQHRNEKNWCWLSFPLLVYDWFPKITILQVDPSAGTCSLYREIESPLLLRFMRGSSNAVLHEGRYWMLIHSVIHGHGIRRYLHYLVTLDEDLTRVVDVSYPFTFLENADIEFCTALKASPEGLTFGWSTRDCSPRIAVMPWDRVRERFPLE